MGYGFTIIGALFKICCELLLGFGISGESAVFARGFFTVIGVVLTVIGIVKTLICGDGIKEKLIGVGIHALIWVITLVGLTFLLPIIILGVVLLVIDYFFLGGAIFTFIRDRFAGVQSDGSVDWPVTMFDAVGNVYTIVPLQSCDDFATYTDEKGKETLVVNKSDVNGNTVESVYGTLHW